MLDEYHQVIPLTAVKGWVFKEGNDLDWAKRDFSASDWKKFNPPELTIKNADKTGRLEGWFRIRVRLDSTFQHVPIGIQMGRWAATDVYIDGRHIVSSGNTGLNGEPYVESRFFREPPTDVDLIPGADYLIAIHLVDYSSPLRNTLLKSEILLTGFRNLLEVTLPWSQAKDLNNVREAYIYWTIWVSVQVVLALTFWFLYFQNRSAKALLLVSISNTCLAIAILLHSFFNDSEGLTFITWAAFRYLLATFYAFTSATVILFLVVAFRIRASRSLILLVVLISVSGTINEYFFYDKLSPLLAILFLLISSYVIVSSWKNLKGAQWALVVGILSSFIWNIFFAVKLAKYHPVYPFPFYFVYATGIFLSIPLSQLVWVAMRFNEVLAEVKLNANKVVHLNEEKKEQALKQQKVLEEEVARQTIELRTAFDNLKSTQSQLIQSEKMASLGELTVGIAHEIENPLNFVNNFSELNNELLAELNAEIKNGNFEEVKNIAKLVTENQEKINHHGKRADGIVKGMLQHSRSSDGQKELTDLNNLAEKYLRLAYHGIRAKDKSFSAKFETDFDVSLRKINVASQDIGSVILNLINNAFYAVSEKKKRMDDWYEPTVIVSTKKLDGKIELSVRDNGNGIPGAIKEKIFQPFFTTKPTGQGTGLGLSLSYDIVKAHAGEIRVETTEGQGSEFTVQLPV